MTSCTPRENISIPPTRKSWWSATAIRSASRPRCSANSANTTLTATRNNFQREQLQLKLRIGIARLAFLFAAVPLFFLFAFSANAQKKHLPAAPVDLNSATAAELQQVPGIGPATAKSIINFREKSGPFRRVEDMLAIHGIFKTALERMSPHISVKPPEMPSAKSA